MWGNFMKNFITRAITGILFVVIVVVSFLEPIGMAALFALITGMSIWEFTGLVNERKNVKVNRFISTAAGVYLFFAVTGFCNDTTPPAVFIPYLLTVVYLFISELYMKNEDAINDWAYTMMSQMYIALPLSCLNMLAYRSVPDEIVSGMPTTYVTSYNMLLPLSIFVFLWINDTGAYCTGSLLGKHKLFPRISPGKSWEGSIGGGIFVILVACLISYIDENLILENFGASQTGMTLVQWIGLGLVVVFFGTWGDLVESLFKRTLGVKDSGSILPGHGGMLDRFDSSLMAIPAAVVYLYSLTLI